MRSNAWRFYVYDVTADNGDLIYVGKGSGNRADVSRRLRGGRFVHKVAFFMDEESAYEFERVRIAELSPPMNRHAGGNGARATPARTEKPRQWEKTLAKIGSRAYAARLLLSISMRCPDFIEMSNLDEIRSIAYG